MKVLIILLLATLNAWALSSLGCLKRLEAMEYHSAIAYGDRLIRNGIVNYSTYFCIGKAHFELKNYSLSATYFERARQKAKDSIERMLSAYYLGKAYEELGDYTRAIRIYTAVLPLADKINSGFSQSLKLQLADLYERVNNIDEALEIYSGILDNAHSDSEKLLIFEKMGDIMAKKENYNMAMENYNKALMHATSLNNIFALSRLNAKLGKISSELKDFDTAIEHYREAINYAKSIGNKKLQAGLYERLAIVYMMKADFRETISNYEEALNLYKELIDTSSIIRVQERLEILKRVLELRREL